MPSAKNSKPLLQRRSRPDSDQIPGIDIDEEARKENGRAHSAQLRKLDQLLKPRSFQQILAEFSAATTPEEAEAAMAVIGTAAQTTPWSELEPALYQAAAAAKEGERKRQLLMLLQVTRFRQIARAQRHPLNQDRSRPILRHASP